MKKRMKHLITIQDLDTRIRHILAKREEGPRKIQRLEQRLNSVEMELEEKIRRLEAFSRDRREIEQRIEDAENKLKKSTIKLSNIKSNKEYDAAMKEIDDIKKAKFLMEEKAIEMMEQMEHIEAECASGREKAAEMKRQFEMDRDAVTRSLKALDQDLFELEKHRRVISQNIDGGLLKRYDILRERRDGIAVSPVTQGVCQACHIRIPPQEFNELIRGDKLMTCPNCTRIIYWGDDGQYQPEGSENSD